MRKLYFLVTVIMCWSCSDISQTEIYQKERDNVVNVKDKVKEIKIEDVLIGGISRLRLMKDYLIILDVRSDDKLIHIFNKNNFDYILSTAPKGEGPNEITNIGHISIDEEHNKFYVSDHGKQKIFSYDLDSVLTDSLYTPTVKFRMNEMEFPSRYQYINDTLCIGLIIKPIGNADFTPTVAKWNMATGDIRLMKYKHPEIEKKRIAFAASIEHNIYVECYNYHDLMTICSLDGKLKYNIYGPHWDNRKSNKISYYREPEFCDDKILVPYSGNDTFSKEINGAIKSNLPTKILIFDINGNYIQTLETGYGISDFCYDEKNKRLIMSLDDENLQFAYLDINGLILSSKGK